NTAMGTDCTEMSGKKCDGNGDCVECLMDADCTPVTETCDATHACVPVACGNNMIDVGETDIDCGGLVCSKCADTKMCLIDNDCQSGVCSTTCQAPTCSDMTTNGDETDEDCGGSCPSACADGKMCLTAADC